MDRNMQASLAKMQEQMKSLHLREERDEILDVVRNSFSSSSGSGSAAESDCYRKASSSSSSSSSRKGLSKHYKGKSQSFTALSNVKSLEDLAKPENPFNAKMRQQREIRRFSGCKASCGGDVARNSGDQPPQLPSRGQPLRAQTLTAAHLTALLGN